MRKTLFRIGGIVLIGLPIAYGVQIVLTQDLPLVQPWKWALLFGSLLLVYFARSRDDVLRHRLV